MELKLIFILIVAAAGVSTVMGLAFAISPAAINDNPAEIPRNQPVPLSSNLVHGDQKLLVDYSVSSNYSTDIQNQSNVGPVSSEFTSGPFSDSSRSTIEPDATPMSSGSLASLSPAANSKFVAAGDWGCKSPTANTVKSIKSINPELVLALGDLSYRDTTTCWDQLIQPIFDKTRIVIGNHDVMSSAMLANYTKHFNLTHQYYSFDHNNVHVLVMSSEIDYTVGSSQYYFVKADLANAASKSSIDWIIVAVHRPMYTSSTNQPAPPDLRSTYHPLFDQYGVDLVLMGHNHNYQRTYPLKFNSVYPSKPIITSISKSCYNDPTGEIYLITGVAGQSLSYLDSQKSFVIRQFYDKYGVSKIEITNIQSGGQTGTIMSISFYKNGDLNTAIDPFKIRKGIAEGQPC